MCALKLCYLKLRELGVTGTWELRNIVGKLVRGKDSLRLRLNVILIDSRIGFIPLSLHPPGWINHPVWMIWNS